MPKVFFCIIYPTNPINFLLLKYMIYKEKPASRSAYNKTICTILQYAAVCGNLQ